MFVADGLEEDFGVRVPTAAVVLLLAEVAVLLTLFTCAPLLPTLLLTGVAAALSPPGFALLASPCFTGVVTVEFGSEFFGGAARSSSSRRSGSSGSSRSINCLNFEKKKEKLLSIIPIVQRRF